MELVILFGIVGVIAIGLLIFQHTPSGKKWMENN